MTTDTELQKITEPLTPALIKQERRNRPTDFVPRTYTIER